MNKSIGIKYINEKSKVLHKITDVVKVNTENLFGRIEDILKERSKIKEDISILKKQNVPNINFTTLQGNYDKKKLNLYLSPANIEKDEILEAGNIISDNDPQIIHLFIRENSIILFSKNKNVNSGEVLKKILAEIGGRGGGKQNMAEGIIDNHDTNQSIQKLKQLLNVDENN